MQRKHICIHPNWNHLCICAGVRDHAPSGRCVVGVSRLDVPPTLFELAPDGEISIS